MTASCDCRLLVVDKSVFEPILRQHSELAERLSQVLIERQTMLRSWLIDRASESAPEHKHNLLERISEFFAL